MAAYTMKAGPASPTPHDHLRFTLQAARQNHAVHGSPVGTPENLAGLRNSFEASELFYVFFPGKTIEGFDYDIIKGLDLLRDSVLKNKAIESDTVAVLVENMDELQAVYSALGITAEDHTKLN